MKQVSAGASKKEIEDKLFKVGDWIDNNHGYFFKIIKVNSIDYNDVCNSLYEVEVWFFRNTYQHNDEYFHWQLVNYRKCED